MIRPSMAGRKKSKLRKINPRSQSFTTTNDNSHQPINNTTSTTSDTYLLTLTKEQLKTECRRRGQKTSGSKMDLVLTNFLNTFLLLIVFIILT